MGGERERERERKRESRSTNAAADSQSKCSPATVPRLSVHFDLLFPCKQLPLDSSTLVQPDQRPQATSAQADRGGGGGGGGRRYNGQ